MLSNKLVRALKIIISMYIIKEKINKIYVTVGPKIENVLFNKHVNLLIPC